MTDKYLVLGNETVCQTTGCNNVVFVDDTEVDGLSFALCGECKRIFNDIKTNDDSVQLNLL